MITTSCFFSFFFLLSFQSRTRFSCLNRNENSTVCTNMSLLWLYYLPPTIARTPYSNSKLKHSFDNFLHFFFLLLSSLRVSAYLLLFSLFLPNRRFEKFSIFFITLFNYSLSHLSVQQEGIKNIKNSKVFVKAQELLRLSTERAQTQ